MGLAQMEIMGATIRIVASGDDTGRGYSVIEQLDPPGGGSPPHANTRESVVITVVDGTLEVNLPEGTVSLAAGQSLSVDPNTRHSTRNEGEDPSRTLYTFVPGGVEGFFADVASLGPAPDLGRVAEIAARYGVELAPPEEGQS